MHRWYDPETGRWISEDPIGFAAGDANLYRYVGNGVTRARDPSGLEENELSRSMRRGNSLRNELLLETTGSNKAIRDTAKFQGRLGQDIVDHAEDCATELLFMVVPGPADDQVADAYRAYKAGKHGSVVSRLRRLFGRTDEAITLAKRFDGVGDEALKLVEHLDEFEDAGQSARHGWRAGKKYDADKVHGFIIQTYNEYLLDGGVPIDFAKQLNEVRTKVVDGKRVRQLGNLNPRTKTLCVYQGANVATLMEELLHYRQAKMLNIWGKEGFSKQDISAIENAVTESLKAWGFIRSEGMPPVPY